MYSLPPVLSVLAHSLVFFFSSRRRHTRSDRDWSSDVCSSDPNANHMAILSNGNVVAHLATFTPAWDLEDGQSQTVWIEYDGPSNDLRVYAIHGNVSQRPATPVMRMTIDLPAVVGGQAWFGFTAGTGGVANNHDIQS